MSTKRRQKNLTVMFTDISGFTKHTETISREDLMSRLDTHNELLMPVIAHFDGEIVKTIGDAFLITFESPTNAVQCGLFMQHTLRKYNADRPDGQQIHIKVSINSGEVTVTDNDVFGDPVNVAAKIEKATNPDEIYFTESVFLAMNKAEVPTSFVKNFRPKGAESTEIKLYKVAMDEGDERYKKIISGTNIDAEENKTKVIELSNTAEKEFVRYQDTLEALVESQGKSSRSVIVAVILAAVILAGAIIGGFALFGTGESEEAKTIESARLFLSNDKPTDARELLVKFAERNGSSDAIEEALREVDSYLINRAAKDADDLIDAGRPERALGVIRKAVGDKSPGESLAKLVTRAEAYIAAREALHEGETDAARENVEIAAGTQGMTTDMKRIVARADAIDRAREIVEDDEKLRRQSNTVIESLADSWGDDISAPVVSRLIRRALESRLYWEARNKSYAEGKQLAEQYANRFPSVGDWSLIEREVHLGGFWNYATDRALRRNWHNFWEKDWSNHYNHLNGAAKEDPEFALRVAETLVGINDSLSVVISSGQDELQYALEARPEYMQTERERILKLLKSWVGKSLNDKSYARHLMRTEFYEEIKPVLEEGLTAIFKNWNEEKPNSTVRANSFAVLADRGDLEAIDDPFGYFRDNFHMFMDANWVNERNTPPITRAQVRRLLQMEISAEDYAEYLRFLKRHDDDIRNKRGRYAAYTMAGQMVGEMLDDLREAHPQYAHLDE